MPRALISVLCGLLGTAGANAQSTFVPPPERPSIDDNNVELVSGHVQLSVTDLTIGQPGAGGLSYTRIFGGWDAKDEYAGYVVVTGGDGAGNTYYGVSVGGFTQGFQKANNPTNSPYISRAGDGSTLVENSTTFTYTSRDGAVAVFSKSLTFAGYTTGLALIVTLTLPDGEVRTWNYVTGTQCTTTTVCTPTRQVRRLQSVTNNRGYQIKYIYAVSTTTNIPALTPNWDFVTSVMGINMAVDYCNPTANSCPGTTQSWPTHSYQYFGISTDQLGGTYKYDNQLGDAFRIQRRNSQTDDVIYYYSFPGSYVVGSVVRNGGLWQYARSQTTTELTTVVTDPQNRQATYVFDANTRAIKSYTNTAGELTTYDNDSYGRPYQVTLPTGETLHYQYDTRGNITEKRHRPSTSGSDLVWSAGFDATCSAVKKCNKPNWTRAPGDPAGSQTDYVYGTAHGQVTSVTLPAPSSGAIRPATTYTYTAYAAYYKNSSGAFVAGSNVYYLTRVAQCRTTSGCSATSADQLRTDIGYGANGVGNNRLPISSTARNGSGSLSATTGTEYDSFGNVIAVDGPLSGAVDRITTRYDALRRAVGAASPNPNDAGRQSIGVRTVFNSSGLPETVETGNLPGQDETAWQSFVPSQSEVRAFDPDGRITKVSLIAGGTTYHVQQTRFDTLGRVECTATRMSPAAFGSLPLSACDAGPNDDPLFGADRITKYGYDNADRLTSVTTGYARDPIVDQAMTYYPGGRLWTLTDGKGNKTTYSYDGHGRLYRMYYPDANNVGASSSLDYEEFGYDLNSQVTSTRRRAGDSVQTPRDVLGRITDRIVVGGGVAIDNVHYSYDNQGRLLHALYNNVAGQGISHTYDGLGRLSTRTVFGRQLGYQYDAAGRRTRLTYPDGFFIAYAYTNLDELSSITDNTGERLATYGYDALGAKISLSRGTNTALTTYVPNGAKQLQQLHHDLGGTAFDLQASFAYNPAGQITSKVSSNDPAYLWAPPTPNSTLSVSVDGRNQLTNFDGASVTDDANGAVRTGVSSLTYTFDALSQLRQATGSSTVSVEYDPNGMLRRVTSGGVVTDYLYDGTDLVAQFDGSGNLMRRFVHGAGNDEPLVSYTSAGTRTWLHADERGSIIAASDESGTAMASVKYSTYGESSTLVSPFGYTGQLYLPELQLYYYKTRMYSPKAGRFLQPDAIGYAGGMNLYAYVSGDPVNLADPSGYLECPSTVQVECEIAAITISGTRIDYCDAACRMTEEYFRQSLQAMQSTGLLVQGTPARSDALEAATVFGGVGTLASSVEHTVGRLTMGTNGKAYPSGWHGNQHVSTTSLKGVAKMAGKITLVAGTAADVAAVRNGEMHPAKAGVNLGVGLWGIAGGLFTAVPAAAYYGLDNFYPGGFVQAMEDKAATDKRMAKIHPGWRHPY